MLISQLKGEIISVTLSVNEIKNNIFEEVDLTYNFLDCNNSEEEDFLYQCQKIEEK